MTGDEWRTVRELFERALEEQPGDLSSWLAAHAPADAQVRAEVSSLLAHHDRAGSFLIDPVAERVPDLFDDPRLLVEGQRVAGYRVVRCLGSGGMGYVYLARDERLGRDVALKALAPRVTQDPALRDRFRREARTAASLSHPGICTVFALEEDDGDLYIVSEYVDGRTLRDDIASGRRPTASEIVEGFHDLADAIASAHSCGITHRDLKPENVMRTADGRWKVLDFGLARVDVQSNAVASVATLPGTIIGTPAYMAPEQLNGEPATPAADVFALGVLVYEWATGVHPFAGSTPLAQLAHVLESDAVPIGVRLPQLSTGVADIIDRCLAKERSARFRSAGEIVAALAGSARAPQRAASNWWRIHQLALMALYIVAVTLAWHVKETLAPGALTLSGFLAAGIAAAFCGIVRGHLVFTEVMNRSRLGVERRRTARLVLVADLAIAAILSADGLLVSSRRALWAMLCFALAIGIALAVVLMEPATTAAVFGDDRAAVDR